MMEMKITLRKLTTKGAITINKNILKSQLPPFGFFPAGSPYHHPRPKTAF
jgi:hypothetical protein